MQHKRDLVTSKTLKMLRERAGWQTEPGLVAIYDIRPVNGTRVFLQNSPHENLCKKSALALMHYVYTPGHG